MAASVFNVRLSKVNLVTKTDFDNRVSSLDNKTVTNKSKDDSIGNELKKAKNIWLKLF